jgi:copper resistance protein C
MRARRAVIRPRCGSESVRQHAASTMKRMISNAQRVAAIIALSLWAASMVFAHAVLVEAHPPARGAIAGPEVTFRLRFNSRIDGARSTLDLVLPDGKVQSIPISRQASPDTLTSYATGMKTGRYTLNWQVLSADGHVSRGQIPFVVR